MATLNRVECMRIENRTRPQKQRVCKDLSKFQLLYQFCYMLLVVDVPEIVEI